MVGEGVCACVQGRVAVVGCVYVHVRCSASVMSCVLCQSRAWCGGCDIVCALRGTDTVVVMEIDVVAASAVVSTIDPVVSLFSGVVFTVSGVGKYVSAVEP